MSARCLVGWAAMIAVAALVVGQGVSQAAAPGRPYLLVASLDGSCHVGWVQYAATPYFRVLVAEVQVRNDIANAPKLSIACVQRGHLMAKLCEVGCDATGTFRVRMDSRYGHSVPVLRHGDKFMLINPVDGSYLCTGVLRLPPVGPASNPH